MSALPEHDPSNMAATQLSVDVNSDHGPVSKAELEQILSDFLKAINFRMPDYTYDYTLEEPVMAHFKTKDWPAPQRDRALKMAKWISTGVGMCYPFASRDSRISFGIHSTYLLLIDDIGHQIPTALATFGSNLAAGKAQDSPVLQSFAEWLTEGDKYMGPFANAMNIKCAIEFVHGCLLENTYNDNMQIPRHAVNFPAYLRAKTGFTEPYAFFCYPQDLYPEDKYLQIYLPAMQDLCEYVNYCNDILSFYKESVVGEERLNYVCNYASAHGVSLLEALRQISASVVRNVQNIRLILADHEDVLGDTEAFIQGYAAWYLLQNRYRLHELQIEY
ncbi:isoprenoid synthase domain-containing protein [Aspergillus unguis]